MNPKVKCTFKNIHGATNNIFQNAKKLRVYAIQVLIRRFGKAWGSDMNETKGKMYFQKQ